MLVAIVALNAVSLKRLGLEPIQAPVQRGRERQDEHSEPLTSRGSSTATGVPRTTWPVGQIDLLDNALLREPLRIEHVKPRLLGHWGAP